MAPQLTVELASFVQSGVSIYLGSRDSELRPRASRIWAIRVAARRDRLTAFGHPEALGLHLPSLESNGQIALCISRPSDDETYQIKGSFLSCRKGRSTDRVQVEAQVDALRANLELIGVPRSTFDSWRLWPTVAIRLKVTEIFCQTPGPGAGEALV